MTKLDNLLYSLTQIILSYHDIKKNALPFNEKGFDLITSALKEKSILLLQEVDYSNKLADLINSSTQHFPDRKRLLDYMLSEINLLKNIKEQQHIEEHNQHVERLLTNLKSLISTSQEEKCFIKHMSENQKMITTTLPGLKRTPSLLGHVLFWVVDTNPTSGSASFALISKVLQSLSISEITSKLGIKSIANEIVNSHIESIKIPVNELLIADAILKQEEPPISTPIEPSIAGELLPSTNKQSQAIRSSNKESISPLLAFSMHGGNPHLMHVMEQHLGERLYNEATKNIF